MLALLIGSIAMTTIPPTPEAVSSFGACTLDGWVYLYGGHVGKAHVYATETTSGAFRRIKVADPAAGWQTLASGPHLQGLALVAHAGKVYRLGGMRPRNMPGEKADLVSVAVNAVYDPATNTWAKLPDFPEGRSSFDAAIVNQTLVVAGGWNMLGGEDKSKWPETTLLLDLCKSDATWESIPQPFARRALNVASADGKVYVVCGMTEKGDLERTVNVLDVATRKWTVGPELPGDAMNGFTPAVGTVGGKIIVSPFDGELYRLDGTTWKAFGKLEKARFVHRLVAVDANTFWVIGGASKAGNVTTVEVGTVK